MARGIKRIPSSNVEPEASEQQHLWLRELVQQKVLEKFGLEGYDPVVAIALMANDPANADPSRPTYDAALTLRAHESVARFTHPTLKQIEVTGSVSGVVEHRSGLVNDIIGLALQLNQRGKGE